MTAPMLSPCESHQSLLRMPEFWRALDIARECPDCYIEEASA
jgi:hypothetical protein